MSALEFPKGFLWGVSTAAHQVEGGNENNNWFEWEKQGRIHTGDKAGLACDWWRNAEQDFDRAKQLEMNALRISVEWSRIEPREGVFDEKALLRYRELVLALKARGLRPFLCLHHFTNPTWFERQGAWTADNAVFLFERFTERVAEALADVCSDWVTFNEPNVYTSMGYVLGEFPPGKRGDFVSTVKVMLAMLRAHAAAYRVLHRQRSDVQVGFTVNLQRFAPENPKSLADRITTRFFEDAFNGSFVHGLETGVLGPVRAMWRTVGEAKGTYDFAGFNHYGWMNVAFDRKRPADGYVRLETPPGMRVGDPGIRATYGGFDPNGLALIAEELSRMGKPIYVLEHGIPDKADKLRPWLIARAAAAMHQVIKKGVDLRGYFHWTLVDNFEWAQGWGLRFGLIELDPVTQVRTPRRSAELFAAIAKHNALRGEDVQRYAPEAFDDCFPAKVAGQVPEAGQPPGGVRGVTS